MAAVLAVGLALGAAGCSSSGSGDDEAATSSATSSAASPSRSSASPSASPSPSASSPKPPVLPAAATEHTQAGATAFVRFWFDALQYGYLTGDTSVVANYSRPTCVACQNDIKQIEDQYAAGGSFRGGDITIIETEPSPIDPDGSSLVDLLLHEAQSEQVDSDQRVTDSIAASDLPLAEFYAGWIPDGWTPQGWTVLEVKYAST